MPLATRQVHVLYARRHNFGGPLKLPELEKRAAGEALDVGWLQRYERPQPNLHDYDRLLATVSRSTNAIRSGASVVL